MPEFGHVSFNGPGFCIDAWGTKTFLLTVAGKTHRFTDSDRFGPLAEDRHGNPLEKQWGERHPFWDAHTAWIRQGRRVAEDGRTCIWDPLRPTTARRVGRSRHLVITVHGDDGGPLEIIEPDEARDA